MGFSVGGCVCGGLGFCLCPMDLVFAWFEVWVGVSFCLGLCFGCYLAAWWFILFADLIRMFDLVWFSICLHFLLFGVDVWCFTTLFGIGVRLFTLWVCVWVFRWFSLCWVLFDCLTF